MSVLCDFLFFFSFSFLVIVFILILCMWSKILFLMSNEGMLEKYLLSNYVKKLHIFVILCHVS